MNAGDELLDLLALRYSVGPKNLASPGPTAEQWARAAQLALRAPDHGGLRPFRLVVVGDSQRDALAELFAVGAFQRGQGAEEVERPAHRLASDLLPAGAAGRVAGVAALQLQEILDGSAW